ncbi:hypothetical protein AB0J83_36400 [Actinoplanes sp. NPDC049596]|uniref:hypothetical protein n=1 Tax=unclassified Actinoplanes TaxID=2626549 RepID=UPI00341DAA6F
MHRITCLAAVIALSLSAGLCAACDEKVEAKDCPDGSDNYNGKCLPPITALFVQCVDAKEKDLTQEVGLGATVPAAANTTFKAAYTRSRKENSAAALEFVKTCLTLAREQASGQDAVEVGKVEKKTTDAIVVAKKKLPAIEVDPKSLTCEADPCGELTVNSTGFAKLQITRITVTGENREAFVAGDECENLWLEPETSCRMTVGFRPTGDGPVSATLVIHQNLPRPDTGTRVKLTGAGTGTGGQDYELTVDAAAGIRVTSGSGGIDCGDTCTATFAPGTDVTLTAAFDAGGEILWTGCDTAEANTCQVRMAADTKVRAGLS